VEKMLLCFMAIWNILCLFGIFYDHLVHIVFIWYICPVLVSCTKKSLATLHERQATCKHGRNSVWMASAARSQSYDFKIYNYNASIVVPRLERFTPEKNNSYSENVLSY
jgi:hypothetical protein